MFTLLVTYQHMLAKSKECLQETEIRAPSNSIFPFYVDDMTQGKLELIQLIRRSKPSQIVLDTRIDEQTLREWYLSAIQDTLAVHTISCSIYSIGDKDLNLPGVIHYYPKSKFNGPHNTL